MTVEARRMTPGRVLERCGIGNESVWPTGGRWRGRRSPRAVTYLAVVIVLRFIIGAGGGERSALER